MQTPSKDEYGKTGKLWWPCAVCLLACRFTSVQKKSFPVVSNKTSASTQLLYNTWGHSSGIPQLRLIASQEYWLIVQLACKDPVVVLQRID